MGKVHVTHSKAFIKRKSDSFKNFVYVQSEKAIPMSSAH